MNRKRVVHALLLSLTTLALVSCVSDTDDRNQGPRSFPGSDDGRGAYGVTRRGSDDGLDLMPPAGWWRDPRISVAVALTNDQVASLDRINHDQGEEIAKLERDSMVAARELRETFGASQPAAADITAAGQRLRGIRDALFDRRVQMFAAERELLTQAQWQALEQQLSAARNRPNRENRGNGGRGGRGGWGGGMGGRGRFPG